MERRRVEGVGEHVRGGIRKKEGFAGEMGLKQRSEGWRWLTWFKARGEYSRKKWQVQMHWGESKYACSRNWEKANVAVRKEWTCQDGSEEFSTHTGYTRLNRHCWEFLFMPLPKGNCWRVLRSICGWVCKTWLIFILKGQCCRRGKNGNWGAAKKLQRDGGKLDGNGGGKEFIDESYSSPGTHCAVLGPWAKRQVGHGPVLRVGTMSQCCVQGSRYKGALVPPCGRDLVWGGCLFIFVTTCAHNHYP